MIPIEVKLVSDVKQCRQCKWFWGTTPAYGPYPAFDVVPCEKLTEADRDSKKYFKTTSKGLDYIDPAILQGCRKAPIMTIGINPNLSGYFASENSTRWCYPSFTHDKDYAEYYRYKTIHQEKTSKAIIKNWLSTNGKQKIIAEDDGWLINIERSKTYRWLVLTVLYRSDADDLKLTHYELDWDTTFHAVILVDNKQYSLKKIQEKQFSFKENDILAGTLIPKEYKNFEIQFTPVKYYQRIIPILEQFTEIAVDKLTNSTLTLGEDVSQHDMIHCASPGWSDKFDIPREHITQNCVIDKAYIITQLLQSRPKVIIIVGFSSFKMFNTIFSRYFNLPAEFDDSFKTLKETTKTAYFLKFKHRDIELNSRVIVVPHFSYDDNYANHSRISPEIWANLKAEFTVDCELLQHNNRVTESDSISDWVRIKYELDEDDLSAKLSQAIQSILTAFHFSPNSMIANALNGELIENRLELDIETKHLKRSSGDCQFCDNKLWSFPKKCEYVLNDSIEINDQIIEAQKIISK